MNVTAELNTKVSELQTIDADLIKLQRKRNEVLEEIAVLAIDATKPQPVLKATPKVGDRVVCIDNRDYGDLDETLTGLKVGDKGTVISIDPPVSEYPETYQVNWDTVIYKYFHAANQIRVI